MWGIVWIIWLAVIMVVICSRRDSKLSQRNENTIEFAVIVIEQVEKIVRRHNDVCSIVTMWQLGETGDGFIIEFYGIDVCLKKKTIIQELDSCIGQWNASDDNDDVTFNCKFSMTFGGNWNRFNKDVWNKVQEKHPDWDIKNVRPHKSVLSV